MINKLISFPEAAEAAINEALKTYIENGQGDEYYKVNKANALQAYFLGGQFAGGFDPGVAEKVNVLVDKLELPTPSLKLFHAAVGFLMDPPSGK